MKLEYHGTYKEMTHNDITTFMRECSLWSKMCVYLIET